MPAPPDAIRSDPLDRLRFQGLALEVAREADPSAEPDLGGFSIRLARGAWSLDKAYDATRHLDADGRREELRVMIAEMLHNPGLPADRAALLGTLVPRITSASRLVCKALDAGWHPDDGPAPWYVELDALLGVEVVGRVGDALFDVNPHLSRHGVSFREAYDIAWDQHPGRRRPSEPAADGAIAALETRYRSPRLLIWDLDRGNNGGLFYPLAMNAAFPPCAALLRTQDEFFTAPLDDLVALEDLLALAESSFGDSRRVCAVPYVRGEAAGTRFPGGWTPWFPDPDHPLAERLEALFLRNAATEWDANVRPKLEAVEIALATEARPARYVGGITAFHDADSPLGIGSFATWSFVGGYLPTGTSHVAVVPPGTTTAYLMRREDLDEPWNEVARPVPGLFRMCDELPGGFPMHHRHLLARAVRVLQPGDGPDE